MAQRTMHDYINEITYWKEEDIWRFCGDGQGDFEETSSAIESKKVLENYIKYCKNQIELAETYINLNKDKLYE